MLRVAVFESYDHVFHGNGHAIERLLDHAGEYGMDVRCFVTADDQLYERLAIAHRAALELVPMPANLRRFGGTLVQSAMRHPARTLADYGRYQRELADRIAAFVPDVVLFNNVRSFYMAFGALRRLRTPCVVSWKTSRTSAADIVALFVARRASFISGELWRKRSVALRVAFRRKVHVVPLGVPPVGGAGREAVRERWGAESGEFWIGTAASITPAKGIHHLVAGVAQLRAHGVRARGIVWGGVPPGNERYAAEIRALIERNGMNDAVVMAGWTYHAAQQFSGLDIYVLASESEGVPRSVLEALMSGVPVVVADVGAVSEIVTGQVGAVLPLRELGALGPFIEKSIRSGLIEDWREGARRFDGIKYSVDAHMVAMRACLSGAAGWDEQITPGGGTSWPLGRTTPTRGAQPDRERGVSG